jgi:hypothetical protein
MTSVDAARVEAAARRMLEAEGVRAAHTAAAVPWSTPRCAASIPTASGCEGLPVEEPVYRLLAGYL